MANDSFILKNAKAKLTRQLNVLCDLIEEADEFRQPWEFKDHVEDLKTFLITKRIMVKNLINRIKEKRENISDYYADCNRTISRLKQDEKADNESAFDEYWTEKKGEEILYQAHETEMKLERRLTELECQEISMQTARSTNEINTTASEHQALQTPLQQLNPSNMLRIPTFEGNPSEFAPFWELFEELVHKQPLSNIEKLSILLNSCKGDAARTLQMIPRTGESYERAVNQLKQQYEDPRRIRLQMIKQLKSKKQCRDDPRSLRNNLSDVQAIVSTLEKQGEAVNTTNMLQMVLETFSRNVQEEMARKEFDSGTMWTMTDLLNNLSIAVKRKEHISSIREEPSEEHTVFQTSATSAPTTRCTGCGQNHKFRYCNRYLNMHQKIARLRELNACWKCFSCKHATESCRKRNCTNCGGPHNLILCRKRSNNSQHQYASSSRMEFGPFIRRQKIVSHRKFWSQSPRRNFRSSSPQYITSSRDYESTLERQHQIRTSSRSPRTRKNSDSPRNVSPSASSIERRHRVRFKQSPSRQRASVENVSVNLQIGSSSVQERDIDDCGSSAKLGINEKVRLMIVPLYLQSTSNGELKETFALLDSASDQSFIADSLAKKMNLQLQRECTIVVNTFGGRAEKKKVSRVYTTLYNSQGEHIEIEFLTSNKITPPLQLGRILPHDKAYILENFPKSEANLIFQAAYGTIEPEILIGMDYFSEVIKLDEPVTRLPSGLIVVPTFFGPVVTGALHGREPEENRLYERFIQTCTLDNTNNQHFDISELWKLSTIGIEDVSSDEEINKQIVSMFYSTVRLEGNRIYVRFPWKPNRALLSSNYNLALSRLHQLLKMRERNPQSWNEYCNIIDEQLQKKFIEDAPKTCKSNNSAAPCYYIPHQAVFKSESATTKTRIVFDASSKMKGELSLNDVIYQGPLILPNLCGVLLRSRIGLKILIADVEKAFHMIHLQEEERDAVRFLWLRDVSQPLSRDNLRILRFCRLPFGVNASPFLLGISVKYGIEKQKHIDKEFQRQLSQNLYVDNVLLTDETTPSLIEKYRLSKQVFSNMSMNLRQFLTNDDTCNNTIAPIDRSTSKSIKILGIPWDNKEDSFSIKCRLQDEEQLTKRKILHIIHSNFDPLGFVIPLLLPAKLFLQDLWIQHYNWDDPVSPELHDGWRKICEKVTDFSANVPRSITPLADCNRYDLHSFVDASTRSFAAATYLRVINGGGNRQCALVMARQRLAPINRKTKPLTIPRLELLALLIGTRLTDFVLKELQVKISSIYVYSDSQVVLHWIQSPNKLGTFVDNRCEEIRNKHQAWTERGVSCHLLYIPSEENPADCATKGLSSSEISNHMWWKGPSFLTEAESDCIRLPEFSWTGTGKRNSEKKEHHSTILSAITDEGAALETALSSRATIASEKTNTARSHSGVLQSTSAGTALSCNAILESARAETAPSHNAVLSATTQIDASTKTTLSLFPKEYSSNQKYKRVTSLVLKFLKQLLYNKVSQKNKLKIEKSVPEIEGVTEEPPLALLSPVDIAQAEKILIKLTQRTFSTHELRKLGNLQLYTDHEGLIRCRGRIKARYLAKETQEPILLPTKNRYTAVLIKETHDSCGHQGVNGTLANLRLTYWVPKGRQAVRQCLKSCVICKKWNTKPYFYPDSPQLPQSRTEPSRPFTNIGADLAGPFKVLSSENVEVKRWIFLATCMVTRAVHLEVVNNLSGKEIVCVLRRFIARRGKPQLILSDNATNFAMGRDIINTLESEAEDSTLKLQNFLANKTISWKFITPLSPWKGGFYERMIGLMKSILKRLTNRKQLEENEFTTLVTECEAMANSRPLTYTGSTLEDSAVLRPVDFLIPHANVRFPIPDYFDNDNEEYNPKQSNKEATIQHFHRQMQYLQRLWKHWIDNYLLELRNFHQRRIKQKTFSRKQPHLGEVVLIMEENANRSDWPMGLITELITDSDGEVRSAKIKTARSEIIRSINMLIPLEVEDSTSSKDIDSRESIPNNSSAPNKEHELQREEKTTHCEPSNSEAALTNTTRDTGRTRPWLPRRAKENKAYAVSAVQSRHTNANQFTGHWCRWLLLASLMCLTASAETRHSKDQMQSTIQCVKGGIIIKTQQLQDKLLVCANDYCLDINNPEQYTKIQFPPEITLHAYQVLLKTLIDNSTAAYSWSCPPSPFCEQITCTFCLAMITNPECWPRLAIAVTACLFYVIILTLLLALYTLKWVCKRCTRAFSSLCFITMNRRNAFRRQTNRNSDEHLPLFELNNFDRRRWSPSAIIKISAISILCIPTATSCQQTIVIPTSVVQCDPHSKTCTNHSTIVAKMNGMQSELCLQLQHETHQLHLMKISAIEFRLRCQKETLYFTRNTHTHVQFSKRCPHMGSCTGLKCAKISTDTLVEELEIANNYTGITYCTESCGGLGCSCGFPSSGCLFYRIYHVPVDNDVYEILQCSSWYETVLLKVETNSGHQQTKTYTGEIQPFTKQRFGDTKIEVTSASFSQIPILSKKFLTNRKVTAYLNDDTSFSYACTSNPAEHDSTCTIRDTCRCNPAEDSVTCYCLHNDLKQTQQLDKLLPLPLPNGIIEIGTKGLPKVRTRSFSVEIAIELTTITNLLQQQVTDFQCDVISSEVIGCYGCGRGAKVNMLCKSDVLQSTAQVICNTQRFVLACTKEGTSNEIKLFFNKARIREQCEIQCGTHVTIMELTGQLNYINGITPFWKYARLKNNISDLEDFTFSIDFPDVSHFLEICKKFYVITVTTVSLLAGAALISTIYICAGKTKSPRLLRTAYSSPFLLLPAIGVYVLTKLSKSIARLLLLPVIIATRISHNTRKRC